MNRLKPPIEKGFSFYSPKHDAGLFSFSSPLLVLWHSIWECRQGAIWAYKEQRSSLKALFWVCLLVLFSLMFWAMRFYYTKEQIQDKCFQILSLALIYWRANNITELSLEKSQPSRLFGQIKSFSKWKELWRFSIYFCKYPVVPFLDFLSMYCVRLSNTSGSKAFQMSSCHGKY